MRKWYTGSWQDSIWILSIRDVKTMNACCWSVLAYFFSIKNQFRIDEPQIAGKYRQYVGTRTSCSGSVTLIRKPVIMNTSFLRSGPWNLGPFAVRYYQKRALILHFTPADCIYGRCIVQRRVVVYVSCNVFAPLISPPPPPPPLPFFSACFFYK